MRQIYPSITEHSFNCPHCGALAHQYWYSLLADSLSARRRKLPSILSADMLGALRLERGNQGGPFFSLEDPSLFPTGRSFEEFKELKFLCHMFLSECFSCGAISIWVEDKLIYPKSGEALPANPDLPDDIRRDYDEASTILDLSPRGAAALLRLAIQKLCKELGQPGKNINEDIGALVAKGLDPDVQKALDIVRVIGNEAVHPGQIDLRDDRATAAVLFSLLNLIVDKMISRPKHLNEIYSKLPKEKLEGIKNRDGQP